MKRIIFSICMMLVALTSSAQFLDRPSGKAGFQNPMLFADVPDHDIILVGDTYYMVSTTMHFAPGCGITLTTHWTMATTSDC